MKLHQLEIENYGIFSGCKFDFSDTGLQLVYGPNEAGKSTLLQLLREVFFGFAVQNRYAFADHSGEMAATASIELRDGRHLRFRRRKGNKDVVVGQVEGADTTVDEAALGAMLGQANARLYENIFGFSLAELVAGERSLKEARVNDALYGGGMGGLANFQQVQADLQNEHQQLFKPKGTKTTINKLLASIRSAAAALDDALIKPRDYKLLCATRDEAEAAVVGLRGERNALGRRFHRAQRLAKALPAWLQLRAIENELDALDVPEGIAYDAEKDYRQTLDALAVISGELAQEQDRIAAARQRLQTLRLQPQLIEDAAAGMIKSLERGLERIESCRADLPKCTQATAAIRYALGETLTRLNSAWTIAWLQQFSITPSQAEAVRSTAEKTRDLARDKKSLETRIKQKSRKLSLDESRLRDLKSAPLPPILAQLTQNSAQYKSDCQNLVETNAAIADAELTIDGLRRKLADAVEVEADRLHAISVPLAAKINDFASRFGERHHQLMQAQATLEAARADLSDYRQRLAAVNAQDRVPDRRILLETRRRRDAGWGLIRRTFLEGHDIDEEIRQWLAAEQADAATPLADEATKTELAKKFEQTVAEADQLADQRQDKAEIVAARERLAADVERAENKLHEFSKIHDAHVAATETLTAQWREMWSGCRIEPDTPAVMMQWLALHEKFLDRLRTQRGLEHKREELQKRIVSFERRLHEAMESQDDPTDVLLKEAVRRVEESRDAAAERRHLEKALLSGRHEIDNLSEDLNDISQRQQQCQNRLQKTLAEIGLPQQWDASLAEHVLEELQQARRELQKADELDTRVAAMQASISDYESRVRHVSEKLAPDMAELPAETAVEGLAQRLADATQAQNTHDELTKTVADAQQRVKDKAVQQQACQEKINRFRDAAGAASDAEFYRLAAAARRKTDLQKEADTLCRDIKTAAATEDIDEFHARLAATDADALRQELQTAQDELAAVERQYEQAAKHAGAAQKELDRIDGRSTAARAAVELQSRRAELRAAVDRWAPLLLAQTLIGNAVARFEREHQSELLEEVARLFSAMTLDRYRGIRRRLDDAGTMLVEDASGKSKEPSQLSTGTREQLYLAIRLAYVGHYCRDAEPLPLVMDDVLVNFDDARATATLEVLLAIAADVQIVFLTCHRRSADLIAARLPQMRPINLILPTTNCGLQFY